MMKYSQSSGFHSDFLRGALSFLSDNTFLMYPRK